MAITQLSGARMLGIRVVRLYRRRLANGHTSPGLSCDEEGVFLCGDTALVMRQQDAAGKATYRERHVAEINFALSAAYGTRNPFPRSEKRVEEWDHAFKYCEDLENKGLLGKGDHKEAGRTYRQCVLGQVSEECGGSSLSA